MELKKVNVVSNYENKGVNVNELKYQINEKNEKLKLVKYGLEKQIESVPKRMKDHIYGAVIMGFFMVVGLFVDNIFEFIITSPGGAIMGGTIEFWIAVITLFVGNIYLFINTAKRIFLCLLLKEAFGLCVFADSRNICTLEKEKRVCSQYLLEIEKDMDYLNDCEKYINNNLMEKIDLKRIDSIRDEYKEVRAIQSLKQI